MEEIGRDLSAFAAEAAASADSAEEMKDTTGVNPWYPSFKKSNR